MVDHSNDSIMVVAIIRFLISCLPRLFLCYHQNKKFIMHATESKMHECMDANAVQKVIHIVAVAYDGGLSYYRPTSISCNQTVKLLHGQNRTEIIKSKRKVVAVMILPDPYVSPLPQPASSCLISYSALQVLPVLLPSTLHPSCWRSPASVLGCY